MGEVTREWKILHKEDHHDFYSEQNIIFFRGFQKCVFHAKRENILVYFRTG